MRAKFNFSLIETTISQDWRERHGQIVEVLGPHPSGIIAEDVGRMMLVRFPNGFESFAWETELEPVAVCSNPHHGFGEHPHFANCTDWQG